MGKIPVHSLILELPMTGVIQCYTAVIIPSLGSERVAAYPNMVEECGHQILTFPYIYSSENNIYPKNQWITQ